MLSSSPFKDVLFSVQGSFGVATLNRPEVLNCLNLQIFRALRSQLREWKADPAIRGVVIQGAGSKGFCAGGDVKSLALKLRDPALLAPERNQYAYEFFVNEYSMDYLIHTFPKPIVVVGHGVTMGGGIGLLAGAGCRIVTSTSILAMPEITIGYFTDVGASFFLNQMPGKVGLFLGLTAARIQPTDALFLGLADFVVEQEQVGELLDRLYRLPASHPSLTSRIALRSEVQGLGARDYNEVATHGPSLFERYLPQINSLFDGATLEEIEKRLRAIKEDESPFPWDLAPFFVGSPTSACLIFEMMRRGQGLSLKQCFDMEMKIALACCQRQEFVEGVRALLIDKDKRPRWNPSRISEVSAQEIDAYFLGEFVIEHE